MNLAAVCIQQLLVDADIRQSWDSIVDILSRPQVQQLRNHSLVPGKGREFSLLQIAHASSAFHPASCSVGMGVAWHEVYHSCPYTVVLRLSVCVWTWSCTHLNACMARIGTTLQIPDFIENTELDSCLKEWLLHTYCWVQLASAIPGHKWQCFFFLKLVDWLLHLSAGLYEPQ